MCHVTEDVRYKHKAEPQTRIVGGQKLYKLFIVNKQFSTRTSTKYQLQVQYINGEKTWRCQCVVVSNDQIVLQVEDFIWLKEKAYLEVTNKLTYRKY